MDAQSFVPDEDASGLDRAVMELAGRMSAAGWTEQAEEVASCMAVLREGVGNPRLQSDGSLAGLYDGLLDVSGAAARITELIHAVYPDDVALRGGRG